MKSSSRKRCQKGKSCGGTCIYRGLVCRIDLGSPLASSLRGVRGDIAGLSPRSAQPAASVDKNRRKSPGDRVQSLAREIRRKRLNKEDYSEDWKRIVRIVNSLQGDEKRDAMIKANAAVGKKLAIPIEHKVESKDEAQAAGRKVMSRYRSLDKTVEVINRYDSLFKSVASRLNPNNTPEQVAKIAAKLSEIEKRKYKAEKELERVMTDVRGRLMKTNLTEKQVKDLVSRVWTDQASDTVRGHMEEFVRMFNGRGFTDTQGSGGVKPILRVIETSERGQARLLKGVIQTNANKETSFHEFAHIVEGQRPWMVKYAVDWRDGKAYDSEAARVSLGRNLAPQGFYRTGPDTVVPLMRLKDLFLGSNYEDKEVALVDNYLNRYMGKVYHDRNQPWVDQRTTEIWSMAVQHFASPQAMAVLYKAHPELFEVVAGLAASA